VIAVIKINVNSKDNSSNQYLKENNVNDKETINDSLYTNENPKLRLRNNLTGPNHGSYSK